MLRSLRKEFGVAVGAGEQAIRVNTDEIDDCIRTISDVCKKYGWELRVWDNTVGTVWYNGKPEEDSGVKKSSADALNTAGPPVALIEILNLWKEMPKPDKAQSGEVQPIIMVMKNFHLVLETQRAHVVSAIQHLVGDKVGDHPQYKDKKTIFEHFGIDAESDSGKFLVGLMPAEAKLPPEISPLFKVIDHELPNEEELLHILEGIIPSSDDDDEDEPGTVNNETRKKACKFALGLTRLQAEGVFSACMVQFAKKNDFEEILPKYVWEEKSRILNKEGLVTLYTGRETFDDVVGLNGLKTLLKDLLASDKYDPENPELRSKGLALVGPPRTGKSLTAKAVGNALGLPNLQVDVGSWFGGIVGDTERNTRKGFQIIRAHAPCIALIDEVEKVMPSAKGGDHDSGVGRRMAGSFMTQMQDIQEPVFWVFTANDTEGLHPAFLADDRVDGVVYVHLPGDEAKANCWKMYIGKFFPRAIGEKVFSLYIETSFDKVLVELKNAKKVNPIEWADRLIPTLLCLSGEPKQKAIARLQQFDSNVWQTVEKRMIDDDGWTPARIKAVCRLARKRGRSLSAIAKMMPRNQRGLYSLLKRLERWAEDEAIDAETGEAYVRPDETGDDEGGSRVKTARTGKVRRTVRKMKDDDEDED